MDCFVEKVVEEKILKILIFLESRSYVAKEDSSNPIMSHLLATNNLAIEDTYDTHDLMMQPPRHIRAIPA